MIRLFRGLTWLYIIGVISIFIFSIFFSALNDLSGGQFMLTAILLLLVFCLSVALLARRRFKKVQKVLLDQCDAQRYSALLSKKRQSIHLPC